MNNTGPIGEARIGISMTKLWAICRNTFTQTIRQPIFMIIVVLTYALLLLGLLLSTWTMSPVGDHQATDQKLMINLGLSTLLTSGMLLAVFSASGVLAREIDDRTVVTVIAKPVSRATFVLGKYAGVALAVTLAIYLCSLAFLMLVRHGVVSAASDPIDKPVIVIGLTALGMSFIVALVGNFMFSWHFASAVTWTQTILMTVALGAITFVGKGWTLVPFGQGIGVGILLAILMIYMAVLLLTAVAISASTRLGQIATLLVCIAVAVVGGYHQLLFGQWGKSNVVAKLAGMIAPDTRYFLMMEPLMRDKPIPPLYVATTAGYAALLIAAVLAIGIALFQTRQLEPSPTASAPTGVNLLAGAGRVLAVGMIVAGALIFGSLGRLTVTIPLAASFLAAGAVLWLISGFFGRGAGWSRWLVLALSVLALAVSTAALAWPDPLGWLTVRLSQTKLAASAVLSAAAVLVCLLPSTRRHFASLAAD